MKFTWDEAKRAKVIRDHKVDFARIIDVFGDDFAIEDVDEEHSTEHETRFTILGFSRAYGLIFLVYIEPDESEIHFITARRAENWMVGIYDSSTSKR